MYWGANEKLLKRWADLTPVKRYDGEGIPVSVYWKWGNLVLMLGQKDGGAYYAYRRDAVQGKFAIVRVDDCEVICTCQTRGGALRCCEELNGMAKGKQNEN